VGLDHRAVSAAIVPELETNNFAQAPVTLLRWTLADLPTKTRLLARSDPAFRTWWGDAF